METSRGIHGTAGEVPAEERRTVGGFSGIYSVSSLGRLRAEKRIVRNNLMSALTWEKPERIIKTFICKTRGYMLARLSKEGKIYNKYMHILVAEAFVENPDGKPEVNHKDYCRANNVPENLEWCTRLENERHKYVCPNCGHSRF